MMQPLDLQMLFSQLDNIGKQISHEKEGTLLKKSMNDLKSDQINTIKDQSVQEAAHEGIEGMQDNKEHSGGGENKSNQKKQTNIETKSDKKKFDIFKDPDIGNYVDLSG
ncbi:hypothetical protein FACS1894102_7350 [Spirochaetia bacterium]|nr:hypothetical protein FACS1894102_7350 [Spirochaetia bacterium]